MVDSPEKRSDLEYGLNRAIHPRKTKHAGSAIKL
jgi:hypothetical protein